jgi:2-enoate reductase
VILFEPGKIGNLSIKNRIVMAPMHTGGLVEPNGRFSQEAIDYFENRARGGVGLIIASCARVSREIEQLPNISYSRSVMVDNDIYVGRLTQLAQTMHDYGVKIAIQLTAGMGRVSRPAYVRKGDCVSSSATSLFFDPSVRAREISTEEVERLTQAFEPAAERLRNAEIDAVELHAHEGYLFDQFMTALWNNRTDKYGGNLEGRLRFPLEVVKAIKRGAGDDFPVIFRFGLTHYLVGGREIKEGLEIARRLEEAGVDALDVDAGCYETWYWAHPPTTMPMGCMADLAGMTKEVVKIPVMAVGKLGEPELAERVLQEGKADFIMLGRPLLADPDWPNKVRERRVEDIRPCIGDHECLKREVLGKYICCTVNAAAGMERHLAIEPAENKKSLLVIGGGPGGMEAARVAALRGHKVTLWEKREALGGNLMLASIPNFKQEYKRLTNYLSTQIKKLGVAIQLKKEATLSQVEDMKPDVVLFAAGSRPVIPKIPGIEKDKVITAIDLLSSKREVGESVVVLGGGFIGCETALYLAQKGKKVTILEILHEVVSDMYVANRMHLLKLLDNAGVKILNGTSPQEITNEGIVIGDMEGNNKMVPADSVVLTVGMTPENELLTALNKVSQVYAIGDCVEPRKVRDAIWEGFRIARLI